MSSEKALSKIVRSLVLGPPPILQEKDAKAYDDLLMQVSRAVNPTNIFEQIWVRDFVDLTLDIRCYRRARKESIEEAVPQALEKVLAPFMDHPSRFGAIDHYNVDGHLVPTPAMELVNEWRRREPAAIEEVDAILASAGVTMAEVSERAFAHQIDKIQQIDQLIAHAEARRNAILREVGFHRTALAQSLRKATEDPVDAEFEPVGAKTLAQRKRRNRSR